MNMSPACIAPSQPKSAKSDHPMYSKWKSYVSACTSQLVEASSFESWLNMMQRKEDEKNGLLPYQIVNAHPRGQEYWKYTRRTYDRGGEPLDFEDWLKK